MRMCHQSGVDHVPHVFIVHKRGEAVDAVQFSAFEAVQPDIAAHADVIVPVICGSVTDIAVVDSVMTYIPDVPSATAEPPTGGIGRRTLNFNLDLCLKMLNKCRANCI